MATVLPKTANWFTYFPEDYRWSAAVGGIVSSAPYGGSDIGEALPVLHRGRPKTPSLVEARATGIVIPSALHGHTGVWTD